MSRPLRIFTPVAVRALAVLVTGLQLGGFLHLSLVEHVTCAEHGELVHPRASQGGTLASATRSDERQVTERAAPESNDEHDHCSAVFHRRAAPPPFAAQVTLISPAEVAVVDSGTSASPTRAILSVAPKQSPPLAG